MLHSLWMVECFPIALSDHLVRAVAALPNDSPGVTAKTLQSLASIRESPTGTGGGYTSLNLIVRPDDQRFLSGHYRSDLPSPVDVAHGWIYTPAPSVAVVVVEFLFRVGGLDWIDSALRGEHQTRIGAQSRVTTEFLTPPLLKQDAVAAARRRVHVLCANWMERTFPGVFAQADGDQAHPSCEVLLLSLQDPLSSDKEMNPAWDSYLGMLGIGNRLEAWRSDGLPGFSMWIGAQPSGVRAFDSASALRLTLAGKQEDLWAGSDLSMYGQERRWQISGSLGFGFSGFLQWWGVWALSRHLDAETARTTTRVTTAHRFSGVVRGSLGRAHRRLLRLGLILAPIAADSAARPLREFANRYAVDFEQVPIELRAGGADEEPRQLEREHSLLTAMLEPLPTRLGTLETRIIQLSESVNAAAALALARVAIWVSISVGIAGVAVAALQHWG